jgi:Bacterial Ig-like domain
MNSNPSKLAIFLLVLFTVCPSDPKPIPAVPVAPVVVSVSPANGATGVTANTTIVVTFSKAMDRATTQAAYQSTDLPSANATFTWDVSDTVMTIKPNTALEYATGTTIGIEPKRYAYRFTGTAGDKTGMPLAAVTSGFSTLRQITATLQSEAVRDGFVQNNGLAKSDGTGIYAGDDATKVGIRGFLSFDLSGVPGGLSASSFLRATLSLYKYEVTGHPYTALNPCVPSKTTVCASKYVAVNLDHVVYGSSLSATDYDTPALGTLGTIDGIQVTGATHPQADVLTALRDDLANRVIRENRSQYRLGFPLQTNGDGESDYVSYRSGNDANDPPLLVLEYLIP